MSKIALIGYPLVASKSPQYHNQVLQQFGRDVTYCKHHVTSDKLAEFLQYAKSNHMLGLSVTMPLKEVIMDYLDKIEDTAQAIGAVNTVIIQSGKMIGYNTDGIGAFNAIQAAIPQHKVNPSMFILGAGGAAKAIAWQCHQAGFKVTIANRTDPRALSIAKQIGIQHMPYAEYLQQKYLDFDVIANATSIGMQTADHPIPLAMIPKQALVFDAISRPANQWLQQLKSCGNPVVGGLQMWLHQAVAQHCIWFNQQDNLALYNAFTNAI